MAQERTYELTVPLGYSDDLGPSKNHPELESILGSFTNLRFRTRMLDALTVEVEMRQTVSLGYTRDSAVEKVYLLSAPAASSLKELGDLFAPMLGLQSDPDDDFRILMRIERGRYLAIKAIKDDMSVHLNFVGLEE
jgi:hypothetical protein